MVLLVRKTRASVVWAIVLLSMLLAGLAPGQAMASRAAIARGARMASAGAAPTGIATAGTTATATAPTATTTVPVPPAPTAALSATAPMTASAAFANLPLSFEPNQGQTDPQVAYLAHAAGYTLFLTPSSLTLALAAPLPFTTTLRGPPLGVPASQWTPPAGGGTVLRLSFAGANAAPTISGQQPLSGTANYFIGNDPSQWHTGIPTYAQVSYHDVYPGIDLAYAGTGGQLEDTWTVQPGADPSLIQLAISGTVGAPGQGLSVDTQGNLVLYTSLSDATQSPPVAYQEIDGQRQAVTAQYDVRGPGLAGFTLGAYDHSQPLVIDPILRYGTYLGGSGSDAGNGIAVDATGAAYVTGDTGSANFPTTTGAYSGTNGGGNDVFVAKLNPAGTGLVYSTYIGGSGGDNGNAIAVDGSGNAYVTGLTSSKDYPQKNSAQTAPTIGMNTAFVTELNSTGTALVYSTYLGGGWDDRGYGIAVDSSGAAYVGGLTGSGTFPTTSGVVQPTYGGGYDGFITKVKPLGGAWAYSTYLGGSGEDDLWALAIDGQGNAYVTGKTADLGHPTTPGAYQTSAKAGGDAFVTELNSTGTGLVYFTYMGGSTVDRGDGIAVDASGNIYVAGSSNSTDFPTTSHAPVPANPNGLSRAVAFKIAPRGQGAADLVYSTYVGGSGTSGGENALGAAVDAGGNLYLTGWTYSPDFPTSPNALQPQLGGALGNEDGFVAKLSASGTALLYSSYLGGSDSDAANAVAVDSQSSAYVTGSSASRNLAVTGYHWWNAGGTDAFVAKTPTVPTGGLTWNTALSTLPQPLSRPAVAVGLDGAIYAFGGTNSGLTYNTTYRYDPTTDAWSPRASMPISREGAQAVTLPNGTIAVMGGNSSGAITNEVDAYNPNTNAWSTLHSMQSPRYRFAAVLYGGQIYAIGGATTSGVTASVEVYNPTLNSWSYGTSLPQVTEAPAAVVDGRGQIDVMGGYDGGSTYYTSLYSYNGSAWNPGANLVQATEDAAAALGPDGQVYVLGGYGAGWLPMVQAYNPQRNSWVLTTPLPTMPLCCMGAVTLPNGQIFAIGGYAGDSVARAQVAIGTFNVAAGGRIPWHPHQSVRLSDHLSAGIDLADGHVDVTASDLSIPARGPDLGLSHTWDSQQAQQSLLDATPAGQGWFSGLTPRMGGLGGVLTDTVTYTDSSGAAWFFVYAGQPTDTAPYTNYRIPSGQPWSLTTSSAGYTLTNILTSGVLAFDSQGRLISDTDGYGNSNTLSYGASGPITETNSGDRQGHGRNLSFTYNGSGLLSDVQSPLWQSGGSGAAGSQHVTYGYSTTNQLSSITWGAGTTDALTATLGYQGQQLVTMTTPYTSSLQFPHTWTLTYDIFGRLSGITSPISGTQGQAGYTPAYTTAFSYSAGLTQTVVVEGYGTSGALTHTYTLDAQGNAPQLTDVSGQGHVHTATYDANHDVLTSTDGDGNVTTYHYSYVGPTGNVGLLTEEDQPAIRPGNFTSDSITVTTRYQYDPTTYDRTMVQTPQGGETMSQYDGHHSVITTTQMVTSSLQTCAPCTPVTYGWRVSTNSYDSYGELVASTDGRAYRTSTDQTPTITLVDPTHYTRHFTDDPQGDQTAEGTPPITTTLNGQLQISTPVTTTYGYDGDGSQTSQTSPNGKVGTSAYDHLGRLVQSSDPAVTLWNGAVITPTTVMGYDGDGNQIYTQDPTGAVTTDSYDPLGRQVAETNPVSGTMVMTYTATRKDAEQDPTGNVTHYAYNSGGQVIKVSDPVSGTIQYAYDGVGNTTTITTGDGTTTNSVETRGYDGLNQEITSTVSAAGAGPLTSHTAYDLDSNVAQEQLPSGDAVVNSYDLADQLTDTENDTGPVTNPTHVTYEHYSYDQAGNQVETTDFDTRDHRITLDGDSRAAQQLDGPFGGTPTMTTTLSFDPDANTITRTLQQVGQTHVYTGAYNADDWRTSATEDGATTRYGFDAAGGMRTQTLTKVGLSGVPLTRVLDAADRTMAIGEGTGVYTTTFGYNASNLPVTITLPGGAQETAGYDPAGRLNHVGATGPGSGATALSSSYDYGYSPLGWTSAVTSTLNGTQSVQQYSYDPYGRLTGVVGGQSWTYDGNDNISTTVSGAAITVYGYDPAMPNALRTVSTPGQPTTYYGYDKDGHTTSITTTSAITGLNYDMRGRLNTVTLPDGTQVTMGYTPEGRRQSYTVSKGGVISLGEAFSYRGPELAQAVVTGTSVTPYTDTYAYNAQGGPLELVRQQSGQTSRYWYVLDGRGNVVAVTNSSGTVVDRYAYDPWGKPTSTSESVSQPFRYAGYWYDATLGWYWLEQRSYDPGLERFLQPDPSQDEGVRVYVYAEDDPLDGTDPTGYGLCEVPLLGGVVCTTGRVLHGAWQFVAGDDFQTLTSDASFGEKAFALVDLASNATLLIPIVGEGVEGVKFATKGLYYVGRKLIARTFTKEEIITALRRGFRTATRDVAEACARCFPAGTLVTTPHGTQAIETLHVGDRVLSENLASGKVEAEPVQAVIKDPVAPLIAVQLSDGSAITVTADHPFWLDFGAGHGVGVGGWIAAGQLQAGDHLHTASGAAVSVVSLRRHAGQAVVYTLTVAHDHTFWSESGPGSGDHTFFVGTARVLVHNSNGCFGVASEIENLNGKTFQEADQLLRQRASRIYTSEGGYARYRFPDGSEVQIRPNGEVIRLAAPEYGPSGARINKGQRLDPSGNPIPRSQKGAHNTGERVIR